MLNAITPNMEILKSPSNWFLVGFCVALLVFISHVIFKED